MYTLKYLFLNYILIIYSDTWIHSICEKISLILKVNFKSKFV